MFLKIISFTMTLIISFLSLLGSSAPQKYRVKAPVGTGEHTKKESAIVDDADFYVSPKGDDKNDGSFEKPFATIEKARDTIRTLDKSAFDGITVAVMAGEYRTESLKFTAEDSGTESCPITYCAYGDGEVALNGGISISGEKFKKITDKNILSRLSKKAQKNVVYLSLSDFGITAKDYGVIHAIGTYHTAAQYDGDYVGNLYCELFVNDKRQTIARYPNEGWLKTEKVVKTGLGQESDGSLTAVPNWTDIRNPESDVYEVSKSLAKRISKWETLDDVWMFGFFKYDWADASSPIGYFDAEKRELSPKFVSRYGTKVGAPYYFFNVFEELDNEGEWYLDRENGLLYLYPDCDIKNAVIDLSLSTQNVIKCTNTKFITFDGFTVKGTRSDAINIKGDNITVKNCVVKNVADYGIVAEGYNNFISENEVTRTGRGGIVLTGGDRETLTNGNNVADNNLIHDWSEIFQTYQPAVTLDGVGNICSHNEIFNSPHEAITYRGNNHIIEYNLIHDVCLLSDDAGAIYSGRRWDWYGNIIRYNMIYNLGSDGHRPDGIYMDDALSGQTIYGNILINVPKIGIHLGGGRDHDVRNNIIINTPDRPFSYDQRAIDGLDGGWYVYAVKDAFMWTNLFSAPWQSEAWQEAFPQYKHFNDNFDDVDNPDFAPNPAYSKVKGNLVVNVDGNIGYISEKAEKFSDIDNNGIYKLTKLQKIFNAPEKGDYTLKDDSVVYELIPDFEAIPVSKIGRY